MNKKIFMQKCLNQEIKIGLISHVETCTLDTRELKWQFAYVVLLSKTYYSSLIMRKTKLDKLKLRDILQNTGQYSLKLSRLSKTRKV